MSTSKFVPLDPSRVQSLVAVLKERLPKSGHVYNCVLAYSRDRPEERVHSIYTYTPNGESGISPSSWVLLVNFAFGSGFKSPQQVSISAPDNPQCTDDVKQAFIHTDAIDWNQNMMINAIDRPVSRLILEVGWLHKKFVTTCYPNYYYTISPEDAASLEIPSIESDSVKVKPLDDDDGAGASFVTDHWKYAVANTLIYAKEVIRRHPSGGVYVDGKPVSGVITHGDHLIGMLATSPSHRNKGYALAAYKTLLRDLARGGYVPSSCAEMTNTASIKFHEKCGISVSHECDYIEIVNNWRS